MMSERPDWDDQFRETEEERAERWRAKRAKPAFTCPVCGAVSHNPNDAQHRYCGRCHRFVDDPVSDRSDTSG